MKLPTALGRILPHLTIVLSLMTLVFFVLDRFNQVMAFMTSELSKWLFALLAACSLATAMMLVFRQWLEDARQARREARRRAKQRMEEY